MGKDTHLINIYIKIHNKRTLTMDDLRYLAKYSPECFEKTCKNVVYNIPESKPVMTAMPMCVNEDDKLLPAEVPNIEHILDNIRRLEANEFPMTDIDADEVKNLLGSLYMEMLYPHNDKETFIEMPYDGNTSLFDKKA